MDQFVIPYIMLSNSREAVAFYEEALGGQVRYQMLGKDMPNCPEGQEDNVMHLEYVINENVIYFADKPIDDFHRIELHLNYNDINKMKEAFDKMSKNALDVYNLKEEFWGATFGRIVDQFNVAWQFHYRPKKADNE